MNGFWIVLLFQIVLICGCSRTGYTTATMKEWPDKSDNLWKNTCWVTVKTDSTPGAQVEVEILDNTHEKKELMFQQKTRFKEVFKTVDINWIDQNNVNINLHWGKSEAPDTISLSYCYDSQLKNFKEIKLLEKPN